MANIDARTKVDLIDGFLGAGKTTFIKRYTDYLKNAGISYIVLENEFGTAGVDARLLDENVCELAGGCICCGMKVNFHDLLIELSGRAERIIVEPSGVFNADDFFDIMDSPRVREKAVCGMMAGVVDPYALAALSETDRRVLYSELICAGVILLSRTDRADEKVLSDAKNQLYDLLGTPIDIMDARNIPIGEIINCAPVRRDHLRMREDHSQLFQCAAFYPEGIYDPDSLFTFARQLFSGQAGDVLRVKGAFYTQGGALLLNATADSVDITPCEGDAVFNVIGHGLKRKVIRKLLEEYTMHMPIRSDS